ncbi:MAG: ribosome biogenesis GTPase Der [Kiritimatiellia bacterium]|nr:ribosome biogenesis GTPase Der [Kiritimatiellia bacterium]
MQLQETRPMVAIIGRPNVGKSSIFNRLAGRRIAIVHEEPGVTRDRIICTIRFKDRRFDLVDTGGLVPPEAGLEDAQSGNILDKTIEAAVRRQVDLALHEASAVIFVVDTKTGLLAADEKTATLLHKSGLPVLLAVNKTDNAELDLHAHDFEKFGFPIFPVSALQNRGFEDLIERLGGVLPPDTDENMPGLRVAIVGRPNVGKSLLVNRLARSERVIVSDEPGTTRDSIAVPLIAKSGAQRRGYILIDTAGLRATKKIKHAVDSYSQLRAKESIDSADVVALVIDATVGPTAYDKTIAAHILARKKGCMIIVNKWDLTPTASQKACYAALHQVLPFMDFVPVVGVSAATGFNTGKIIETINYVAEQNREKISTGILNRELEIAGARFQAPLVRGRRLKIFYATQTAVQPITFLIFVNDPDKVSSNYEKYLEGSIRKSFGFEGAPIVFEFRKRKSRTAEHLKNPRKGRRFR